MKNTQPKVFKTLLILAPIFMVAGIILVILANTVLADGIMPNVAALMPGSFLIFIGFACLMFGLVPVLNKTAIKLQKHIQEENKEDLTSIANTKAEINKDAIQTAVKTGAQAVKQGMRETKYCKECGAEIDLDSKFCSKCGKEQ